MKQELSYQVEKSKPKNCTDTLKYEDFRRFFFSVLRQNDLECLLLSYLLKKDYGDINPQKRERISAKSFLDFMEMQQKQKLSMEEYRDLIKYFDPTADDFTLSVQGIQGSTTILYALIIMKESLPNYH